MSQEAMNRLVAALTSGAGLKDDFIYYMSFDDYKTLADPFARVPFTVKEVEASIRRYPNPEKPGELFQWDIHGQLFTPAKLFITYKSDLNRLCGKKLLHIVGENDKGHWIEGGEKGLQYRREVYAFNKFKPFADALRLVIVPNLTHYGHVESYNAGLANIMVTGFKKYFIN
jgi:hypothetical protein